MAKKKPLAYGPQHYRQQAQARNPYGYGTTSPQPQGPPPDPFHTQQSGLNTQAYNNRMGDLQWQRGQVHQEYGFDDTSNPYNRAALLEKSYKERQSGNLNSMASRGQLYSGALQRQQEAGTHQYGVDKNALRTAYTRQLQSIAQGEAEAGNAYAQGNLDSLMGSYERAQSSLAPDSGPGFRDPEYLAQRAHDAEMIKRRKKRGARY